MIETLAAAIERALPDGCNAVGRGRQVLIKNGINFWSGCKTFFMADNKDLRDGRDRSRVAGDEEYEIQYIAEKFNVSAEEVRRLIEKVGNSREEIERYLKEQRR
jgi:hypothetical protein